MDKRNLLQFGLLSKQVWCSRWLPEQSLFHKWDNKILIDEKKKELLRRNGSFSILGHLNFDLFTILLL